MNKELSLILLGKLSGLPYIDKSTGVVQIVEKPVNLTGETVYKKIPVSTLASATECGANDLSAIEMIPSANLKGMLYFEDKGLGIGLKRSASQQYKSDMRLVCWLNTKLISNAPDMLLTSKVMNEIVQILTGHISNSLPFINISVTIVRIPQVSSAIFSAYDYDEKRTQYLLSPYDFFALDLSITFDIPNKCLPEINIVPITC